MLVTINSLSPKGQFIWRETTSAEFYVRIAYHLKKKRQCLNRGEGSRKSGYNRVCDVIQKLDVPNAEKVFLWRACNNLLPTKQKMIGKCEAKEFELLVVVAAKLNMVYKECNSSWEKFTHPTQLIRGQKNLLPDFGKFQ